jgi:hypothetical protein
MARTVAWLSWAVVAFAVLAAVLQLALTLHLVVPFPEFQPSVHLEDRLIAFRAYDQQVFPLVVGSSLASLALFATVALLGTALRWFAKAGPGRDVMAVLFILAGTVGIVSQVVNLAVGQEATEPYCVCEFIPEQLIAQDMALLTGWEIQLWLVITAVTLVGIAAAAAGRVVPVGGSWTTLSYVIAAAVLFSVGLRLVAMFVGSDFDLAMVSDIVVALVSIVLVPIWGVMLARAGSRLEPAA